MLATAFPNLDWLKKQASNSFADRRDLHGKTLPTKGWPNVIMNATTARVVRDNIVGPLSIFTTITGKSTVTVGGKRVPLTPGILFLSNAGQSYTLEIDSPTPTQTGNIHFGEAFSQGALRSMTLPNSKLLEQETDRITPNFYNRVIPIGPEMQQILSQLISPGRSPLEEEELLYNFLEQLVAEEIGLRRRQEGLHATKASTRQEVLKRMLQVTDYLHSSPDAQPDLGELARISCLSKFHFLRLFKIAFGQTPHQFLTSLKIESAKRLLRSSQADAKAIATALGYKDASSFSRQFFHHVGAYPTQYRRSAS